MFTGLVETAVAGGRLERRGSGARLVLPRPAGFEVGAGESVAVSGACLTNVASPGDELAFDLSAETLARTWFGELDLRRRVNLERSLRLSDRLGGHLVSESGDGGRRFSFRVPGLERYLIEKGSIAIDGISLTVVAPRGALFDVAVIPATLAATSLGRSAVGDRVHVEADLVGKWIERLVAPRAP
jgi:riboflavin synthase